MFWTPYGLLILPPLTARVNELTNITGRLQQTHCENGGMRNNDASTIFNLLVSGLRSQVVYSKQPKFGLMQEFVVLLVRMRLVVCMFVCLFVCLL